MTRRRYLVGCVKLPHADRDLVHEVLADGDRGWRDILGADTPDDHERHPVGADVVYTLELDDDEAERFRAASNLRYLEEDQVAVPGRYVGRVGGTQPLPDLAALAYLGARYVDLTRWHGRDVTVAVLDSGTTPAVRAAMGWTLVARTVTSGITLPDPLDIYDPSHEHGSVVGSVAVPPGGRIADAVITDASANATLASIAAGITWAADQGAKVANLSHSFIGVTSSTAVEDAVTYAAGLGMHIVCNAGNESTNRLNYPALLSATRANVHSSVAFDSATDRLALFSNFSTAATGVAPGVGVAALSTAGTLKTADGTSLSAPLMTQTMARALTGATFTTAQVATALRGNCRDTGAGSAEQGAGAWDLQRALAALGAVPSTASAAGAGTVSHIGTFGGAGLFSSWNIGTPSGIVADDMRIMVLVSSVGAKSVVPPKWTVLTDSHYDAGYEISAGQAVGPTRVRVLAKAFTDDEPTATNFSFGGASWFSAETNITLRGVGGLDPERFVPQVRFGTGGTLSTLPVLPATTNDTLLTVFAQRHPTSLTGTLTLPAGLTQRGFWRPTLAGTTTGYTLLAATAQLATAARTAVYSSVSNDATGTWCTVALTVPTADPALATVVQTEPASPPGAFLRVFPGV